MKIKNASAGAASTLWADIEPGVKRAKRLEDAAQELAKAFHTRFEESVIIARVFMTTPFRALPASNQGFVRNLAKSVGAEGDLPADTPVLSLVGTYGQEKDWQDRRKSKGHVGIPLISSSFVGAIPMIARLLSELGVPLEWVDQHRSEMIIRTMGSSAGLFFVDDASDTVDDEGRKVIAAQDFVAEHGVKTVFGTGGAYSNGQIMVLVVFCRDTFTRDIAEHFLSLTNLFMAQTTTLAEPAKVFADA